MGWVLEGAFGHEIGDYSAPLFPVCFPFASDSWISASRPIIGGNARTLVPLVWCLSSIRSDGNRISGILGDIGIHFGSKRPPIWFCPGPRYANLNPKPQALKNLGPIPSIPTLLAFKPHLKTYLRLVGNGRVVAIVVIIVPHSSIPY